MATDSMVPEGAEQKIKTTETDLDAVREQLQDWLGDRMGTAEPPRV